LCIMPSPERQMIIGEFPILTQTLRPKTSEQSELNSTEKNSPSLSSNISTLNINLFLQNLQNLQNLQKKDNTFQGVYTSEEADTGGMVCSTNQELYFIKNFQNEFDVASIDFRKEKANSFPLTRITALKNLKQIIDMDGVLLVNDLGKTFILKGNPNFKFVDILAAPDKSTEGTTP
jgi:hypothetical protein